MRKSTETKGCSFGKVDLVDVSDLVALAVGTVTHRAKTQIWSHEAIICPWDMARCCLQQPPNFLGRNALGRVILHGNIVNY